MSTTTLTIDLLAVGGPPPASETLPALLLHNEVQVSVTEGGALFVAVRPYDCAPLWYHTTGPTLDAALAEAACHRLATYGRRREPRA